MHGEESNLKRFQLTVLVVWKMSNKLIQICTWEIKITMFKNIKFFIHSIISDQHSTTSCRHWHTVRGMSDSTCRDITAAEDFVHQRVIWASDIKSWSRVQHPTTRPWQSHHIFKNLRDVLSVETTSCQCAFLWGMTWWLNGWVLGFWLRCHRFKSPLVLQYV